MNHTQTAMVFRFNRPLWHLHWNTLKAQCRAVSLTGVFVKVKGCFICSKLQILTFGHCPLHVIMILDSDICLDELSLLLSDSNLRITVLCWYIMQLLWTQHQIDRENHYILFAVCCYHQCEKLVCDLMCNLSVESVFINQLCSVECNVTVPDVFFITFTLNCELRSNLCEISQQTQKFHVDQDGPKVKWYIPGIKYTLVSSVLDLT